ncbi:MULTISPECIES: prolipoprotein diacylglyceryl transferase [Staphylococcus]|uniref:Phosphatidylglycerol--prolipoprotein diacylglyceryl transferase n=1 Tax=Staphylococcus pettenkoferi TaxID=170573 RepID=A0A2N6QLM4_9STAP|nr:MULTISPECIES: prolipoprotein diacylglyceryl transferase [Staphylococcus]MBX8992788.1 prolipoprotein diacylglyceryl transferase [Staphylococcus pettenkoferi]MCI2791003.1 prolipoprotein diacylglyceryl transferase [Staphylococcus pettenkoferi]MCY1566827.1 prolipoprotein diacylglyceryl transferase [Staphylococcus pettenkoferi]MCY1587549.1 prolipoprotein diacylglyceryl transferase [Staphylococcus pettenkoferi]MCY1603230.1 prolipoprotein diacylglyceryl transferase [Staphylococcus pettenkoferi]
MNFTLNYIDPVAFQLGPIAVRWYGIIIACGILLGYFIAQRTLQRVGFDKDVLVDILFWSAIIGFIVARIYFVIFQFPYYAQHPAEIPKIWHGGIAIHGGIIGGFITGIFICKRKNINPFQMGDIAAPSMILAQGIGRWGNFMNHEAHGGPVSRSFLEHLHIPDFIIDNMYINGVYYHPTFLYESIWDVLGFIILLSLRKHLRIGDTFALYLIWYSIGRFFVEGLRTDSLMLTSHIRIAQLMSIVLVIVGIVIIIIRHVKFKPQRFKEAKPLPWPNQRAGER